VGESRVWGWVMGARSERWDSPSRVGLYGLGWGVSAVLRLGDLRRKLAALWIVIAAAAIASTPAAGMHPLRAGGAEEGVKPEERAGCGGADGGKHGFGGASWALASTRSWVLLLLLCFPAGTTMPGGWLPPSLPPRCCRELEPV